MNIFNQPPTKNNKASEDDSPESKATLENYQPYYLPPAPAPAGRRQLPAQPTFNPKVHTVENDAKLSMAEETEFRDDLMRELSNAKSDAESSEVEMGKLQDNLMRELSKAESDAKFSMEIKKLQDDHMRELSKNESDAESVKVEMKKLQDNLRELSKAESDATLSIAEENKLRDDLMRKLSDAESDAKSSKIEMARLQNERDNLRKRHYALRDYLKIEGVDIQDLENLVELRAKLAALQLENNSMKGELESLSNQGSILKDEVDKLVRELSDLRQTSETEKYTILENYERDFEELNVIHERELRELKDMQERKFQELKDIHERELENIQKGIALEAELIIKNATAVKQRLENVVGL